MIDDKLRKLPAPDLLRQTVRHDLAVASVSARYVCAGWNWSSDHTSDKRRHPTDGVAVRGDVRELVEVELTVKTLSRYSKIFTSHDERMRFDGVTSVMYLTNERVKPAIDERIERRVFVDDRPRFTVLPVIDIWGRVQDDRWPYATPRFTPMSRVSEDETHVG